MNVFIGLDVSLASTAICVLGPQGQIVEELQAESEPEALVHAMTSCRTRSTRSGSKPDHCPNG
jgi:hypothetical protein